MLRTVLAVGALVTAIGACAAPDPSPEAGLLSLPTVAQIGDTCAGVGITGFLTGSPDDPRVAWVAFDGGRTDVVFPPGYRARFAPGLEILNAAGVVVARQGDEVDGACVIGGDHLLFLPEQP